MKEISSILRSQFIIDGVRRDCCPAELLESLKSSPDAVAVQMTGEVITDELLDRPLGRISLDNGRIHDYLKAVSRMQPSFRTDYPATSAVQQLYRALLDAAQFKGDFSLEDISVTLHWKWNTRPVGALAAFYESVRALCGTLGVLPVNLAGYDIRSSQQCSLSVGTDVPEFRDIPPTVTRDYDSWIIYVPFETSEYKLGSSLLASSLGIGGAPPRLEDADYFIDCFEITREMISDGVALSSATVGAGGLLGTLKSMTTHSSGISADISQLMQSHRDCSAVQLLFAEVPGIVIQVRDEDFDYVDAEFLLQDVAYYALGHVDRKSGEVSLTGFEGDGIGNILYSLMRRRD